MRERILTGRKALGAVCFSLLLICGLAWLSQTRMGSGDAVHVPSGQGEDGEPTLIWHSTAKHFLPAEKRTYIEERWSSEMNENNSGSVTRAKKNNE